MGGRQAFAAGSLLQQVPPPPSLAGDQEFDNCGIHIPDMAAEDEEESDDDGGGKPASVPERRLLSRVRTQRVCLQKPTTGSKRTSNKSGPRERLERYQGKTACIPSFASDLDGDSTDEDSNHGDGWVIEHNFHLNQNPDRNVTKLGNSTATVGNSFALASQVDGQPDAEMELGTMEEKLASDPPEDISFPLDIQDSMEFVANASDRSMAELYALTDQAGAPRHLMDDIISTMKREKEQRNFSPFMPGITTRKHFFSRVSRKTSYQPPFGINITLESGQKVVVRRFDYLNDLEEKLVSEVYSNLDNIRCDMRHPFANIPPPLDDKQAPHLLDFSWYRDTYNSKFLPMIGGSQFDPWYHLLTLSFYTDATSRALRSIEPVALVDSRLTDVAKRDPNNWIIIGYMPYIEAYSSATRRAYQSRAASTDMTARDYHLCMTVLLEPLLDFVNRKPKLMIRRGQVLRSLKIVTEFSVFTLDNKAADMVCARLKNMQPGSVRMTRRCYCNFDDTAKPLHGCFPVDAYFVQALSQAALGCTYGCFGVDNADVNVPVDDQPHIRNLIKARMGVREGNALAKNMTINDAVNLPSIPLSENLDSWLQYLDIFTNKVNRDAAIKARGVRERLSESILRQVFGSKAVDNPFARLPYGANINGIHSVTTADILHTMKSGVIQHFLNLVIGPMTDGSKAAIDRHVEQMFAKGLNRSGEASNYPRVSFRKGFTKLTELTGSERVGQLFVLAFLLRTKKGRKLLLPRLAANFDENKNKNRDKTVAVEGASRKRKRIAPAAGPHATSIANAGTGLSRDEALQFLRLDKLVVEMEKVHSLPHNLHVRLEEVLKEFLTKDCRQKLYKHKTRILQLPMAISMDYRCSIEPTGSRVDRNHHEQSQQVVMFPPSTIHFDCQTAGVHRTCTLSIDHLSYLCETLLTYWAFLEYADREMLSTENISRASANLELMRRVLVNGTSRGFGTNGYSYQKFIEMFHLLMETPVYGRASGRDTNDGERHLKVWAVRPAKTAQKRDDGTFTGQISIRRAESEVLGKILKSNRVQNRKAGGQPTHNGSKSVGRYRVQSENEGTYLSFRTGKNKDISFEVDPLIVHWLSNETPLLEDETAEPIYMYTKTELADGSIIRCHPDFEGRGPRYDCVSIQEQLGGQMIIRPARVVALLHMLDEVNIGCDAPANAALVMKVIENDASHVDNSQLFRKWTWASDKVGDVYHSRLHLVPMTSIKRTIYCIDEVPCRSLTKPSLDSFRTLECRHLRTEWASQFLTKSSSYLHKKMQGI